MTIALAALAVVASGFGPRVVHRTADMPPLTLRVVLHEPAINVVFAAFIVAMLANDLRHRRRPHPVTIWGGLLMFVSLPVRSALSQTAAWHHIAQWLIR